MQSLNTNEIRDYLARAPKRWHFNGLHMVNNTQARFQWLATLLHGTLDERINRRAGLVPRFVPFYSPVTSAIRRNKRRNLVIAYGRKGAIPS